MQVTTDRSARLWDELTQAWAASGRCEAGVCGCGEERGCAYRRGYREGLLRAFALPTGEHPGRLRARLEEAYLTPALSSRRPVPVMASPLTTLMR